MRLRIRNFTVDEWAALGGEFGGELLEGKVVGIPPELLLAAKSGRKITSDEFLRIRGEARVELIDGQIHGLTQGILDALIVEDDADPA